MTIATAGHVDHGKTSLVNVITGVNTDTLAEEKSRGLTINLGFAYYHFSDGHFSDGNKTAQTDNSIGFVDVPGHTDFIQNMLAGVGMVDNALLVVAADDGIMPQTREHLAILDLLGIKRGVIAITKIDRVDTRQLSLVKAAIRQLVADTCVKDAEIFPVSSVSGEGIAELIAHLQSMLQTQRAADNLERYFRFAIDRSFTVSGIGTVVTGTVGSGQVSPGDQILHSASGELTRVKSLRHDDREISQTGRGQRVAINITLPYQNLRRGDWLMHSALFCPVYRLDATLRLLVDTAFKPGTLFHLHLGTAHYMVSIRALETGSTQRYFQIKSSEPMIAHYGDRFILRDPASQITLGGGWVIDIHVPRRKRDSSERITALKALDQHDLAAFIATLETQSAGLDLGQFSIARNLKPEQLTLFQEQLSDQQIPFVSLTIKTRNAATLLHRRYYEEYTNQIGKALATFHQTHNNQTGMSEPALSRAVDFNKSHLLFHALLESLLEAKLILRSGGLFHLPDHNATASAEEQAFIATLRPLLLEAEYVPPRTGELVELLKLNLRTLEKHLQQAKRNGFLIQVAVNRYYLPETLMKLADMTEQIAGSQGSDDGFTVIQFRDHSGIGRNLCIEILEYFDRIGFTRRDGNSRFVRTEKENVFGK